jgi:hypothetical protein
VAIYGEAIRRVLASSVVDRAVGHALSGPLVDTVGRDVARYAGSSAWSMNLGVATPSSRPCCAEAAEVPQRMIDRLLADGVADRIADRLLDGPEVERLAARVIDSRLLDTIVERLLESEELWRLVDEIACSPAVTDAIGQQGVGFADQSRDRCASSRSVRTPAWSSWRAGCCGASPRHPLPATETDHDPRRCSRDVKRGARDG